MRVAYLNTYGNGSTGKIVDDLKACCKENGIEAISIYSREFCRTPDTSIRFFSKIGFYYDALMTRLFDRHGLSSYRNTKRIIKYLDSYNPDLVHIHNLHGYWINYKILFKWLSKKKKRVVFTLHDCWLFTGHCTHFDYIKCFEWKECCVHCKQKNEYPQSYFNNFVKRNYLSKKSNISLLDPNLVTVVTPSAWLNSLVRQSFLNRFNSVVINNGVDLSIFHKYESDYRNKYNIGDKKIVLCVANYWNTRKGLEFVLSYSKSQPNLFFVVIGKVVDCYFDKNDYPNVLFIDRTDNQIELAKWYSEADVYLNTTLEDTYPTTNLEAIACGTPVVTFNTGGSPEIVLKTNYGCVIERNQEAIETGINNVLSSNTKNNFSKVDLSSLDSKPRFMEYIVLYKKMFQNNFD